MNVKILVATSVFSVGLLSASNEMPNRQLSSLGNKITNKNITPQEVEAAQHAWGQALVKISKDFDEKGIKQATRSARQALDQAYGYNLGPVLFKPTLTHGAQTFRTDYEGALAYFVGNNKKYAADSGFALKGWRDYQFTTEAVHISGDVAITMGKVMLTDKNSKVTVVDKTWGFKKDNQGQLRIILHHSSLPYDPKPTEITKN